ncbi:hypothetical protein HMPREF2533_03576 [Bacteroides fragilis]|nr:hypothetical protein HMPREF2530_03576 [Bacteroides fragilis]KXU42654.1 hypothetical protein HMPREF2533_03576 [Bacteroides fragilis]
MQNWESYSRKTNLLFLVFLTERIMCLLSVTYHFPIKYFLWEAIAFL